jgi:hypothetical protein
MESFSRLLRLMQDWLTSFAYRADISFTIFLLAELVTVIMAWRTTLQRPCSVAVSNPVDGLRAE